VELLDVSEVVVACGVAVAAIASLVSRLVSTRLGLSDRLP
jgi:hypothetical protein